MKTLVLLATLGALSSARAQEPVALLDYHTTAPAEWVVRTPSSTSRLAQFVIPAGADTTEVVVFYFGASMSANLDANLARWRGQFSMANGSPVPEKVTRDTTVGKFPVTIAEFRGTYRRGVGAGSADSVRAGQTLIATIVETPRGVMFVQCFGPSARVDAERGRFLAFVKGVR